MNSFTLLQKLRNKIKVDASALILMGENVKLVNCSVTIKGRNNVLEIEDNAVLRGVYIEIIGDDCAVRIGRNSMIGDDCYLSAKENGVSLRVGANCALSRNVKIMTSDGHPIFKDEKRINCAKDVIVEDGVWIADNVTVLKGVKIGKGCVVGINSTVVRDVENNSVAVGNPCRVVKSGITWRA